jgi:CelD/BcsL family acetyltransferase involved in cellulose biosynthesis
MIETYARISEIRQPWDEVVHSVGAPVFYTAAYLDAYENAPLQQVEDRAYLVLREGGAARMVLPVTYMSHADPIGALTGRLPGFSERPTGLLSHIWHCYDSWLPGTASPDGVVALLDRFRSLAKELGAGWYGLVNVDRRTTGAVLEEAGLSALEVDDRYSIDLTRFTAVEDYIAALPVKYRNELRRQHRRAVEAGLAVRVVDPPSADWASLFPLVVQTAAKHGNQHFYRDGIFQDFVLRLGSAARVVELRLRDRLIAGAICMVDSQRYHFWTAGVDYAAGGTFSPYYALTIEGVRDALSLGVPLMECGRRNGVFKQRYGMSRLPLYAYLASV